MGELDRAEHKLRPLVDGFRITVKGAIGCHRGSNPYIEYIPRPELTQWVGELDCMGRVARPTRLFA